MKGGHKKQHAVVTFTIHTLKLPKHYPEPFVVEFKRGNNDGLTERTIAANGETEVNFEKRFRVAVTFYISKKDQGIRKKKIAFTVYRFLESGERKVFGTFEVDVSKYYDVTVPKMGTFDVESPHREKSQVIMSFAVVATGTGSRSVGNTMTEDNLTSLSEAIQLTTDRQEEWDVSEAMTPEAREHISEFFRERERVKREHALADFQQRPTERKRKPVIPGVPDKKPPLPHGPDSQFGLSSFLRSRPVKSPAKSGQLFNLQIEPKQDEEKKGLNQQSVTMLLRSVLIKHWDESPIDMQKVPKPAAALFAALLHTQLFEQETHIFEICETVLDEFVSRYRTSVILDGETQMDKWFVSLWLLKLVTWQPGLAKDRVELFSQSFSPICRSQFEIGIEKWLEPFMDAARAVIHKVDNDASVRELGEVAKGVKERIPLENPIGVFLRKRMMIAFDGFLVHLLITNPDQCTFGNAVQWNTLVTIVSDDLHMELPLFRQAVSTLMMGAALCSQPAEKDGICKDLSCEVVLKLLSSQKPDDFMPVENDIQEFCMHYNLTLGNAATEYPFFDYEGDFSELNHEIDCTLWNQVSFDSDTMEAFKYLKKYFKTETA